MNKNKLINTIFYPRPSENSKDEKDILINVEEDIHVATRLFLIDKSCPTIIFFHANVELNSEYDWIADYYNQFKINFIVCSYRGYGLSSGNPSKEALHEDSITIFKYLKKHLKKKKYIGKIIVMGRSLGTAAACEVIAKHEDTIDGCIIESGFATEYPLLNLMNINPDAINYKLEDGFMNLQKLKNYKGRLLIIHGDLDDIVPFSQAELMLLEAPSSDKESYRVHGGNHNNILMLAREEYFKKIQQFIYK